MERLLDAEGLDVNSTDYDGLPALMHAIAEEQNEVARLLIDCAAVDVNAKDNEYNLTALMVAIAFGNVEVASMILERAEVEVNAVSAQGYSAYAMALKSDNDDMVHFAQTTLIEYIATHLPVPAAAKS